MNRRRVCSSVLHVFFQRPNLSAKEIPSRIFAPPSPSIVDNVFHKSQGLRTIYFILWLSLREFFMIVCLVWFSLMTREDEIGMKSSAPGDSREAGDFLYPLYRHLVDPGHDLRDGAMAIFPTSSRFLHPAKRGDFLSGWPMRPIVSSLISFVLPIKLLMCFLSCKSISLYFPESK
jgi:hypothetical protein